MAKIDLLLGLQWGDEGKGKVVDALTPHYDIVARFQGGPNAGHTIEFDGKKFGPGLHVEPGKSDAGGYHQRQIHRHGAGRSHRGGESRPGRPPAERIPAGQHRRKENELLAEPVQP